MIYEIFNNTLNTLRLKINIKNLQDLNKKKKKKIKMVYKLISN